MTEALTAWGLAPSAAIEQFGGAEINSHNFKVHTSTSTWLCKRAPVDAELRLQRALALAAWLAPQHVGIPGPVPASDASLLVSRGDWVWCVWPFIDGMFFHSGATALQAAASVAGRLHRRLEHTPMGLWPVTKWTYGFEDAGDLLDTAATDRANWTAAFGPIPAERLARWSSDLPALVRDVSARVAAWGYDVLQPCHGDLHPHNLLMQGSEVAAILDVDSLVVAPYPVTCGFARYKLVRQAASAGGDPQALGRAFAMSLRMSGPRLHLDDDALRDGARAEVLRRLLLVLRLHYREGNSRWNHVLGVHLSGLDEIAAIG